MNTWVEYWKKQDEPIKNNHAQMRENSKWVKPDEKDISRRFFDKPQDATVFAKRMCDKGYHATIKTDGGLH